MIDRIKKVVTIGGGTGSFMLLSGLKDYPVSLSAIVSMADDGGSTGILRDELGVLPPGDVRQCLVALSNSSDIMRDLMTYRFEEGGLKGHNFGNLLLSALEKITGNFSVGVEEAAKILNIKGEVIPVADTEVNLFMELKNGKLIKGEDEVRHNFEIKKTGVEKSYLSPRVRANKKAIQKILEADLVIIGPGDYYGSIMPNFLVQGISDALRKTKATVVFNCNLVNRKGQTDNFTLDDYVELINKQIGKERIDFATFNTKNPGRNLIKKYEEESMLVELGENKDQKRTYRIIKTDLLSDKRSIYSKADSIAATRAFIRHDSEKLARVLMVILELGKYEGIINEIV
ncbi:MAG: gluconeogenesis factor YvcK family protein [Parcubacteria group bacterium]|jgi:uncharacterized cofD-like protein